MRKSVMIDIEEVSRWYDITEEGNIFSRVKGRWLKPTINSCGYVHYCITYGMDKPTWVFAHTLVALKYIGKPPTERHEIDHLDENKSNNYHGNLRWRTHRENILESFRRGRRGYWTDRSKPSPSVATKVLMANAKKKRVVYDVGGDKMVFESIDEACGALGTYRKKVYLCIKGGKPFGGGMLSFLPDEGVLRDKQAFSVVGGGDVSLGV